jgi:RNA polymerase sigma factor (sigma-70 family)
MSHDDKNNQKSIFSKFGAEYGKFLKIFKYYCNEIHPLASYTKMNPEEFKIQVLPLKHKLFRLSFRILGDREEAEDSVQDALLKLWMKKEELKNYTSIEAFAMTVTKNISLDRIRSKSYREERLTDRQANSLKHDPGDILEKADFTGFIKKIIDGLPEQQKAIIQMRDIEGMEFEQIAEITDLNVNAIRVNLSRARKHVRDIILKIQGYELARN